MKRKVYLIALILIVLLNSYAYGEIGIEDNLRSYILADAETGIILESYNIDEPVEIASTSKLMTFAVVMDRVEAGDISLDDLVLIDKDTARVGGSTFKLKGGEEFTVGELLEASIVVSGNDATYGLAKYVGGTEANFVKMMNEKARELGLDNALFYNSTGLPIYPQDVQNIMTTRELFQLSKYIIENYPEIMDIASIKALSSVSRDFFSWNTNPLIPKLKEVDGLKTGFTNKAGYCHVCTFKERGREGLEEDNRFISIVMGAEDIRTRNRMSEELVKYGMDNYSKKIFLDPEIALDSIYMEDGEVQEIEVFASTSFSELVREDEDIELVFNIDESLELPIKKDQVVGDVNVVRAGKSIYKSNLQVREDLNMAKWYVKILRKISNFFSFNLKTA